MVTAHFCDRLGYYEAGSVNYLQTFEDTIGPTFNGKEFRKTRRLEFLTVKDRTDRLSRNLAKVLPLHAV